MATALQYSGAKIATAEFGGAKEAARDLLRVRAHWFPYSMLGPCSSYRSPGICVSSIAGTDLSRPCRDFKHGAGGENVVTAFAAVLVPILLVVPAIGLGCKVAAEL